MFMVFSYPSSYPQHTLNMVQWCQTCSEERKGGITQPGPPQFRCSVVDPVLLPRKLILGVEVMIAHGCIDLCIWRQSQGGTGEVRALPSSPRHSQPWEESFAKASHPLPQGPQPPLVQAPHSQVTELSPAVMLLADPGCV